MTAKCKANPPTKKAVKIKENMMVAKDEGNRKSQDEVSTKENNEVPEMESDNDSQMLLNAMGPHIHLKRQVYVLHTLQ